VLDFGYNREKRQTIHLQKLRHIGNGRDVAGRVKSSGHFGHCNRQIFHARFNFPGHYCVVSGHAAGGYVRSDFRYNQHFPIMAVLCFVLFGSCNLKKTNHFVGDGGIDF
jgi:hypothetical protein